MVDYYFCSLDDTGEDSLLAAIATAPLYAVAAVREQFEKCDPSSLRDLGRFLNALKHESAVNLLEELSQHENASVARAALGALAENGTPAAAFALSRNFEAADKQTRKAIILLLAGVNQVASLQTLLRVAHMRDFLNRRLDERIIAIQALGRLGNEQAEPTLNALARTRGLFRRRTAAKLRRVATRALARLHGDTDTYTVSNTPPEQG
jgi:HEAT repeat protein